MTKHTIKKRCKKALAFSLVLCMLTAFMVTANAESELTLNYENANIYVLDEDFKELLGEIPSEYPNSVKLEVKGTSSSGYWYVSKGNSVTVDENGLVTPCVETWYWYDGYGTTAPPQDGEEPTKVTVNYNTGVSTVTCVINGKRLNAEINVIDYSDVYVDEQIQAYIDANITDTMTDYEKAEKACQYAASFVYSPYHSGYNTMIIYGGGDCWASAGLITYMCNEFLGIESAIRYGVNDPGAGSGHRNSVIYIDGKYYAAEAGYSMPAPRPYDLYELEGGFSYSYNQDGYTVYQYDGRESDVVIPATYNDSPVTKIDKGIFFYNYWDDFAPKSVSFPHSITSIDPFAFSGIRSIESYCVDEENTVYSSVDGVIYSKDKSKLISYPSGKKGVFSIPEGTTRIGEYSVYYAEEVTEIILPNGVTHIEEGAFGDCPSLKNIVLPDTLESIESFAFYNDPKLKEIYIPQSVTTIGENAFSNPDSVTIYGEEGSYAQEYALAQGIKFATEKETEPTETTTVEPTETTTVESTIEVTASEPTEQTEATEASTSSEAFTTESTEITPTATETEPEESTTKETSSTETQSTTARKEADLIFGDADSDGFVKIKDVTAIQKYAASIIEFTDNQMLSADVNSDTKVNIKDATAIQKWLASISVDYPIGKNFTA